MVSTLDIIQEIANENKAIKAFSLVTFGNSRDIVKDKKWTDKEFLVFGKALESRKLHGLPFWEALMITQLSPQNYSEEILRSTNYHNFIKIFKTGSPENLNEDYMLMSNIGLNSKVIMTDGHIKHLPMIDFRVPYSDLGTEIVSTICTELGQNGYIINSGKSYHFLGADPLPHSDFISFLGKTLLFSPLVDTTWVGHQLIDGSATLRIGSKNGVIPKLVKRIHIL